MLKAPEIRDHYPTPRVADRMVNGQCPADSYCVAGAYMLTRNQPFPFPNSITRALVNDNPVLDEWAPELGLDWATCYSNAVISSNDAGNIELAWTLLDDALTANEDNLTDRERYRRLLVGLSYRYQIFTDIGMGKCCRDVLARLDALGTAAADAAG